MECTHKTSDDHMRKTDEFNNVRLWMCSNCGKESEWTRKHSSYGSIECKHCERAIIDWVACCDKCAAVLARDDD